MNIRIALDEVNGTTQEAGLYRFYIVYQAADIHYKRDTDALIKKIIQYFEMVMIFVNSPNTSRPE